MRFYVQIDSNQRVRDCIEYPHEGYVPVELALPLPDGFLGGWYRMVDGKPVFDQSLYDQLHPPTGGDSEADIAEIKAILRGEVE